MTITLERLIKGDLPTGAIPAMTRLRKSANRKQFKPKETKANKEPKTKEFNYESFWSIANVRSHVEFENYLRNIVLDRTERERFYKELLGLAPELETDTFKPYFELYSAERKTNMQDYTPDEVASLLAIFTRTDASEHGQAKYSAYDMTAGTGTLLISKWNDDRIQETPWSYAPHRYFYFAEEMADNSIPYLIHNFAMRGMNAIVVHGDSLHREIKQIYFLQNSQDDFMSFSDINVLPHNSTVEKEFDVRKWTEGQIDHKESQLVKWNMHTLPMHCKRIETSTASPKFEAVIPWKDAPQMKDIAFVERAQKNKIYPKGSLIIQLSATRGQLGLLESNGLIESQYAVITLHYNSGVEPEYLYRWLQRYLKEWLHRVQEGLNVSLSDIATMPVFTSYKRTLKEIEYGQQFLF